MEFQDIIAGCIQKERKAQEKLYRHFFPIMERMVLRYTQDDDQIIDILNNGFLKVFNNLEKFEQKGSFEGWIRKIVFRCISDYFRKYKKDLSYMIYEESFKKEPIQKPDHQLYLQDLMGLVDKLPDNQSRVFHLHAIEGYSHKEISALMEINENTSRWYLSEARKLLQKEFTKHYSNSYYEAG